MCACACACVHARLEKLFVARGSMAMLCDVIRTRTAGDDLLWPVLSVVCCSLQLVNFNTFHINGESKQHTASKFVTTFRALFREEMERLMAEAGLVDVKVNCCCRSRSRSSYGYQGFGVGVVVVGGVGVVVDMKVSSSSSTDMIH